MTEEGTRAFFQEQIKHLEERITLQINSILEKMDRIEQSVKEKIQVAEREVVRNKDSIGDLYEKNRLLEKEIGVLTGRVSVLEDDKNDKRHNIGTIIAVVGLVITAVIAIIGWLT
jgi:mevalonate kinase